MSALQITLTEQNGRRLGDLARQTGRSPDELANHAVERLVEETTVDYTKPVPVVAEPDWKAAWRQAAGMWKDRDDIPELMDQFRREWNRVEPPDEPL
jgi:hypothetical protein